MTWRTSAACLDHDPSLFFLDKGDNRKVLRARGLQRLSGSGRVPRLRGQPPVDIWDLGWAHLPATPADLAGGGMSDRITLYRVESRRDESDPSLIHFWDERVGEFQSASWCKAHGDWVGHMVPVDGRRCRWALKVDGNKPCDVVDRWMEAQP
jgi:hypothetical protein